MPHSSTPYWTMLEKHLHGVALFHHHNTPECWPFPTLPACGIFDILPKLQQWSTSFHTVPRRATSSAQKSSVIRG